MINLDFAFYENQPLWLELKAWVSWQIISSFSEASM